MNILEIIDLISWGMMIFLIKYFLLLGLGMLGGYLFGVCLNEISNWNEHRVNGWLDLVICLSILAMLVLVNILFAWLLFSFSNTIGEETFLDQALIMFPGLLYLAFLLYGGTEGL